MQFSSTSDNCCVEVDRDKGSVYVVKEGCDVGVVLGEVVQN